MKRPSRFTGNVWLVTRYTTADSIVYIGGLSAVVEHEWNTISCISFSDEMCCACVGGVRMDSRGRRGGKVGNHWASKMQDRNAEGYPREISSSLCLWRWQRCHRKSSSDVTIRCKAVIWHWDRSKGWWRSGRMSSRDIGWSGHWSSEQLVIAVFTRQVKEEVTELVRTVDVGDINCQAIVHLIFHFCQYVWFFGHVLYFIAVSSHHWKNKMSISYSVFVVSFCCWGTVKKWCQVLCCTLLLYW